MKKIYIYIKVMKTLTRKGMKEIQKYVCHPEKLSINLNFDWNMT
jgi:hypothetical protein